MLLKLRRLEELTNYFHIVRIIRFIWVIRVINVGIAASGATKRLRVSASLMSVNLLMSWGRNYDYCYKAETYSD